MESNFISDGKSLGYAGMELRKYIDERKASFMKEEELRKIEDKTKQDIEREVRAHERELRKMEYELEMARIQNGSSLQRNMGTKPQIKLSKYEDGQDISIYLSTFEKVKAANNWSEAVAITALHNVFFGSSACKLLEKLPQQSDYAEIKRQLICSFGQSIYVHQRAFRGQRQGTETFRQYAINVKDNLDKMCDMVGVGNDFVKLQELIVKDQILCTVDKNLCEFLKERDVFRIGLDEVIVLAENYQAVHAKPYQLRNNSNGENVKEMQPRNCFRCQEYGHIARNCPKMEDNVNLTSYEVENLSLPSGLGLCNGKNVTVLRETGATSILVRKDLIRTLDLRPSWVNIKLADGSIRKVQKGIADIECRYVIGWKNVLCVPNLPYDVIIGNVKGAGCPCSVGNSDQVECMVSTRAQKRNENIGLKETAVSRSPVKIDLSILNREQLIKLQKQDDKLKPFYDRVGRFVNSYPRFELENEVLIRISAHDKSVRSLTRQIVLPACLKTKIMEIGHDTVYSGHLGIRKTKERIMMHYFWPGCFSDIARFCRSCHICQKRAVNRPVKVPLQNLPVIGKPLQRVAIDLIGPLPVSQKGNRFALVALDLATKYPDAVALKNIDSLSIAEALMDIFARLGLPDEILHDQGTQFISEVMQKFNRILRVKGIKTSPYNPKCNGSCENFNKTLKQMLKKLSCNKEKDWDRYLQPLLFAYREVPQASTGFSPFELLFGYDVRGPLFLMKEKILAEETSEVPITEYVMEMRNRVKEFMDIAIKNEACNKAKQKKYYDKGTKIRKLKVGDKCLLMLPTSSSKLLAEWKGPFEVVRKINNLNYVIRLGDSEKVYHINMLKKYYERESEIVAVCNRFTETIDKQNDYTRSNELSSEYFNRFPEIFSSKPGKLKGFEYKIKMDSNVKPKSKLPYKIPFHLKQKVKEIINEWLDLGIIQKSNSEWTSPVVVVVNKDKSLRLTVDYRAINPHINTDSFPMPLIDTVIESVSTAKFISKIDLTKAFSVNSFIHRFV